MITPLSIYFITVLDGVFAFFSILAALLLILSFFSFIYNCAHEKNTIKLPVTLIISGIISWIMAVIIPTTNQMAAILIIPKIANSEVSKEAQKLPDDLIKLAEKYIQNQLNDSHEKKENK